MPDYYLTAQFRLRVINAVGGRVEGEGEVIERLFGQLRQCGFELGHPRCRKIVQFGQDPSLVQHGVQDKLLTPAGGPTHGSVARWATTWMKQMCSSDEAGGVPRSHLGEVLVEEGPDMRRVRGYETRGNLLGELIIDDGGGLYQCLLDAVIEQPAQFRVLEGAGGISSTKALSPLPRRCSNVA